MCAPPPHLAHGQLRAVLGRHVAAAARRVEEGVEVLGRVVAKPAWAGRGGELVVLCFAHARFVWIITLSNRLQTQTGETISDHIRPL